MSPREQEFDDPDDFFKDTRMSLGDHIEDLRKALWRAVKGFLVAVIFGFMVANHVLNFISSPVERQLMHFYDQRVANKAKELAEEMKKDGGALQVANEPQMLTIEFSRVELARKLGLDIDKIAMDSSPGQWRAALAKKLGIAPDKMEEDPRLEEDKGTVILNLLVRPVGLAIVLDHAQRLVGRPPLLVALSITEAFVIWMKVGIYTGIVLASPWIFWQIWMFIAAGLYPHERKLVHYYLPLSLGLFLGGVCLCEFVVLPIGIRYLLSFNEWLKVEPDLRLSEWLSFAILMPLIFGIAFQLPLVMYFLDRIGLVRVELYIAYWRIAIFILVILSGLLQVSTDPFSMMAMAIPLCMLYGLGILLCRMSPRPERDLDVPDPEEMVEV